MQKDFFEVQDFLKSTEHIRDSHGNVIFVPEEDYFDYISGDTGRFHKSFCKQF